MEESALQLYEKEIDEANKLHEWLGFGIGVFQGEPTKPLKFLSDLVLAAKIQLLKIMATPLFYKRPILN